MQVAAKKVAIRQKPGHSASGRVAAAAAAAAAREFLVGNSYQS